MANVFKTTEIIDIGIEKEKKRQEFYDLAAKAFTQPALRTLFTRLADWEVEHIKKFKEIRATVTESETVESFAGEMSAYIGTFVDESLYGRINAQSFPGMVRTPLEAVNYGIGFEKDAILFFTELLPYIQASHREAVRALINEEKQHIIYLTDMKESLGQ